jgi:hypothetical protein
MSQSPSDLLVPALHSVGEKEEEVTEEVEGEVDG